VCLLPLNLLAQTATWIYYPGDFEIWLGNEMQNRRTERGAFFPPFWKMDSPYVLVEFSKKIDLKTSEEIEIKAEGIYNVKLDGKLLTGNPGRINIPSGKHSLNIKVYNQKSIPAIYVRGKTIVSDESWLVTFEDKEWIDASGKASDTSSGTVYLNAGCWNFHSPEVPPSQFKLETQPLPVVRLEKKSKGTLFDFGKETFGYPVFHHLKGNDRLHIYYGESKEEALAVETCETLDDFTFNQTQGKDFQVPVSKAFRYIYVEDSQLSYDSISMLYEYLPLEYKGAFRCNDDLLNKIWEVSAYTLHLTTREFFIDGIKRDRWIWSGDVYQSALMNYYLFFDSPSVSRTMLNLRGKDPVSSHINTIMDYTFYWFICIYDYYRYTGDKKFIERFYPRMKSLMDYCLSRRNANGMMEGLPGDWVFIDWADFRMSKAGEVSFEQLLFYRSLETMALCAEIANRPDDRNQYKKEAEELFSKFFPAFWSEEKNAFVHNREKGVKSEQVTPYTNVFAVLFNYLDEEKTAAVKQSVLLNPDALKITTPYMRFYELEALCILGEQEYVLKEIRDYWGGMLRLGATSFWEKYNPNESGTEHLAMYGRPFGKSLCHAWGAGPLYLLGKYYLGVKPEKEGYKEFSIRPVLGDLQWMEGSVPTPHGAIQVYMDKKQIKVFASEDEGYLYFKAVSKPQTNDGIIEEVSENEYKLRIKSNKEYRIQANFLCSDTQKEISIVMPEKASPEINFGVEKLKASLEAENYRVMITNPLTFKDEGLSIVVERNVDKTLAKEGYSIFSNENQIRIQGNDAVGALYGCIDLAKKIKTEKNLPTGLNYSDRPEMVLRGACVGVQKPYYLPGRSVYEYPYTPETFPWLYDKALWIEYLDMLVENKMNSLYLWNGHPFASLVKLKDYPYAVEVDNETFKKNEEIFAFLTEEAQKRGIWVIQMFYNIIVSKPFAEHHGIRTQDRSRPIDPLISDYTRQSIAAFIEKYPNVGLLVCLGEAIDTYEEDVKWFTETILPGVKDGLKALGRTDEPPIVLRAHDTDASMVMDAALPLYKNLYTMHKYNGESLTTYEPRGPWSKIHTDLSSLGSIHISNVHILANLEPFRYGSPDFIQKSVLAMHNVHGANALHLYPQASYWDWPYTADKEEPRIKEIERDWIWYEAWARYAWNAHRDREEEMAYWSDKLGDLYGCGKEGRKILEAYEQTGEIAPKLLRKFGITEGNRQTLLLGMFMSQLVNPAKWRVYSGFHSSCGPEGELLIEYVDKEWKSQPHAGEVPPQLIQEALDHGNAAVNAIEKAALAVTKNQAEFNRLKNDVYCYQAFAAYFAEKVKAALSALRYTHSDEIADLEKAIPLLEKSLEYYKQLVSLTKTTYLYANSMQTGQRRIPVGGDEGKNKTWEELLPLYEKELADFKKNVAFLKNYGHSDPRQIETLQPVEVELEDKSIASYPIGKGEKLFSDENYIIGDFAEELKELKPFRFSFQEQIKQGTTLTFECKQAVRVWVGYLNTERREFAQAPTLETDASANQYGQSDVKIANALYLPGRASVNIHTYTLPAGKNTLNLGKGALIVLGFTDANRKITPRNAGVGVEEDSNKVDWLFY
jgi:hypothetical protein